MQETSSGLGRGDPKVAGNVDPPRRQQAPPSRIEVAALLADLRPSVGLSSEPLLPLSQFVSRLSIAGDQLSTPFDALVSASSVAVHAVLERTAVVSDASGERRLVRQANVLVNPWQINWWPEARRRRGSELTVGHPARLRRCSDCGRTPAETRFYDLSRTYCSDCQRRRQRPERAPSPPTPAAKGPAEVSRRQGLGQEAQVHVADSREETDRCHPRSCELGTRQHQHCSCGLPMRVGAAVCRWCDAEGLDPTPETEMSDADPLAWDGRTYPSRRRRRISAPEDEGLRRLLVAVLAAGGQLGEPATGSSTKKQGGAGTAGTPPNGGHAGQSASIACERAPMTW